MMMPGERRCSTPFLRSVMRTVSMINDVLCGDEITHEMVTHIVRNLRDRDRRELYALRWDDDEDALIDNVWASVGAMWRVWCYQDEPVAIHGVMPLRPGVVSAAGFGTDKWHHVCRPVIRWSRHWVIPRLKLAGYHRAEAFALAANASGRHFIELIGGRVEAYLHKYGRNREDFILYTWRLDE